MKRLIIALSLVALASPALAKLPGAFHHHSLKSFLGGETKSTLLNSRGWVGLAPAVKQLHRAAVEPLFYSVATHQKRVFVGTGHGGWILSAGPKGRLSPFAATGEMIVTALRAMPHGRLAAGTAPNGKVFLYDKKGRLVQSWSTGSNYIWSLAVKKNTLYAGTGPEGKILSMTPGRKDATVVLDTDEHHIMCLATGKDTALYAGTEPNGLILAIEDKKARLVLDSEEKEVRALALAPDGTLYAATGSPTTDKKSFKAKSAPKTPTTTSKDDTAKKAAPSRAEKTVLTSLSAPATKASIQPKPYENVWEGAKEFGEDRIKKAPVVYRIDPGGTKVVAFSAKESLIFSLLVTANGRLLIGTGDEGILYRLEKDGSSSRLARFDGSQILAMARGPRGRTYAVTGNPAALYAIEGHSAKEGSYRSTALDAGPVSRWGRITCRLRGCATPAGPRVKLFARSGNSKKAKGYWGHWEAVRGRSASGTIRCRPARYLQYRVDLREGPLKGKPGPRKPPPLALREVKAFHRALNRAPKIRSITVKPPKLTLTTPPDRAVLVDPKAAKKDKKEIPPYYRVIEWDVVDPDKDTLAFHLDAIGPKGQSRITDRPLRKKTIAWDTRTVPDGSYCLKLIATDSPTNGPDDVRSVTSTSIVFVVDNSPPTLSIRKVIWKSDGRCRLVLQARDGTSTIANLEFAVDGKPYRTVFPDDGIADEGTEDFTLSLGPLSPKAHKVILKVYDAMGNVVILSKRIFFKR